MPLHSWNGSVACRQAPKLGIPHPLTHSLPPDLTLCRLCFKRLVVSEDAALRFLYERVHEMQDAGYVAYRSQWMAQYQAHIFAAEKLEAMVRPLFPPVVLLHSHFFFT